MLTHVFFALALGHFLDIGGGAQRHTVGTNSATTLAARGLVHVGVMLFTTVGMDLTTASALLVVMLGLGFFAFAMHVDATALLTLVGFLHDVGVAARVGDGFAATGAVLMT